MNSKTSIDKVDGQEIEWQKELRGLSAVVDNFQLPILVKVAHGFLITEENALGAGSILTIHGKREVSKILAHDRLGRELHISLDNENKVKVIPSKYCIYKTIKDVCASEILPPCIKNTIEFEFNKVFYPVGSSFLVISISKNVFGKKGLVVTDLSQEAKKLTLPFSVQGNFQEKIRPSDENHTYLLEELAGRKLPISVSFAQSSHTTTTLSSSLHASYTNVTLEEVYTVNIVYATSYIGEKRHLITIPKDMDVKLRIGCKNDSQYCVIAEAGYEPVAEDVLKCLLDSDPYSGDCKTAIYESLEETVQEARRQIDDARKRDGEKSSTVSPSDFDGENAYTEAYPQAKEENEANSYQPLLSPLLKSEYQPLTASNTDTTKTYDDITTASSGQAMLNEYSPESRHSMTPPSLPPRPIKRHTFSLGSGIAGNGSRDSKECTPPKILPRGKTLRRNEEEKSRLVLLDTESKSPLNDIAVQDEGSSEPVLGSNDIQMESTQGPRRKGTGNPLDSGSIDGESKNGDDSLREVSSASEQINDGLSEEDAPLFDLHAALYKLKLESFHTKFEKNQIDMELLVELAEDDLVTDLGMTMFQARKLLLYVKEGWSPDEDGVLRPKDEATEISRPPTAWSEKFVFQNIMNIKLCSFAEFCKENQVNGKLLTRIIDHEMLQCLRDSYSVEVSKIEEKKLSKFVFGGWRPKK